MKYNLPCTKNVMGLIQICLICAVTLLSMHGVGQTFPPDFSRVQVSGGLSNPTAMAMAPDGRVFITLQGGALKVIKNGALLPTSAISLSVNSSGERGLIGITLDPNFSSNNFVYLYYTVPSSPPHNRISRFTFNGDVITAGSEVVLLDLNNLSSATNHNAGSLAFGGDGKLYIAVGENANGSNAQTLDNYLGKVLRVNSDGSVPAGNPFSGNASRDRIWVYGLRNPFTIAFQPGSNKLFINDVGENTWEEIDDATTGGKNFGWPNAEGICTSNCTGFTNPIYTYQHGTGDGKGCAITGGIFFNPTATNYPGIYAGKYFFMDYCNNWINYIDPANPSTRNAFATNIGGSSIGIRTGIDGKLYYLSRGDGALYRIEYTPSGSPVITAQPQNITVHANASATFTVTASGAIPFSYQWKKNSINISGANAASYTIANVQSADAGTYSVVVSNSAGSTTSNDATLSVSPNADPVASITTPANNATYRAGDVINFTGTGSDPEDGTLPAGAFNWSAIFHHDAHTHPGPSVTVSPLGTSGSFTVPTLGETSANVWFELVLTVTDSNGATNTTSVRINPITSTLTLTSSPSGLQVKLDDQPVTTPYSVTAVSGMVRTLDVVTPQTINGSTYLFNNWSNTTTQRQDITISDNAATYLAVFSQANVSLILEAENAVKSGVVVSKTYAGYTGTGFADYIHASSDYIEWTANVPATNTYTLGFRYALKGKSRPLEIKVNGVTVVASLAFPNTASWTNWSLVNLNTILNAGNNTIRATAIGSSGANVDHLEINSISGSVARNSVDYEIIGSDKDVNIFPLPASDLLKITSTEKLELLKIFDLNGASLNLAYTQKNDQEIEVNVSPLNEGLYLVSLKSGSKYLTRKLSIKR